MKNPKYPFTEKDWQQWGVSIACPICKSPRGAVCTTNGRARFGKPHKTRRSLIKSLQK
jgi:hypothetical protein